MNSLYISAMVAIAMLFFRSQDSVPAANMILVGVIVIGISEWLKPEKYLLRFNFQNVGTVYLGLTIATGIVTAVSLFIPNGQHLFYASIGYAVIMNIITSGRRLGQYKTKNTIGFRMKLMYLDENWFLSDEPELHILPAEALPTDIEPETGVCYLFSVIIDGSGEDLIRIINDQVSIKQSQSSRFYLLNNDSLNKQISEVLGNGVFKTTFRLTLLEEIKPSGE